LKIKRKKRNNKTNKNSKRKSQDVGYALTPLEGNLQELLLMMNPMLKKMKRILIKSALSFDQPYIYI